MTIQVNVSSFEELKEFARAILGTKEELTPQAVAKAAEEVKAPEPVEEAPEVMPETVEGPAPAPAEEEKTYTLTEVRGYLAALRKAGKKEEVSKLIADMGYEKFTQVPEEKFPELMRRAEEL